MTFTSKQLQALAKRRHPGYAKLKPHWDFLELSYRGGREWFADNIFRYHKEGNSEFTKRRERAYRFNHTREVVDLVTKYLFRGEVHRNEDAAPDCVKKFWKRATRDGLSITEQARVIANKSSIFGHPWIIVDRTGSQENGSADGTRSRADEKQMKTYCYIVDPQDALDYSYDEDGQLQWLLCREWIRDDNDPIASSGEVKPRYRLWTKEAWYLIENDTSAKGKALERMRVTDQGEYSLGRVPAIPAKNLVDSELYGSSPALISDIAYLDRAVTNYLSNLDAIIQDQTFSQLAMPAQGLLPGDDEYKKMVEMGTKRVFLYDGESGAAPHYLSPDPRQAALIVEVVSRIISEIYHSVGLAGERTKQDNSKGIDNSSGVAKQNDFERVNALLISKSDALEWVENQLVELVCLWEGKTAPKEDLVNYPDNFDAKGLFDEMDVSARLSLIQAPAQVKGVQMKRVIEKAFPFLAEDLLKKLRESVDEQTKREEEMQIATASQSEQVSGERDKMVEESKRDRKDAADRAAKTKGRTVTRQQEGEAK